MCRHQSALKYQVDIPAQPTKCNEATQLLWMHMFAMGTNVHRDVIDDVKILLCAWWIINQDNSSACNQSWHLFDDIAMDKPERIVIDRLQQRQSVYSLSC